MANEEEVGRRTGMREEEEGERRKRKGEEEELEQKEGGILWELRAFMGHQGRYTQPWTFHTLNYIFLEVPPRDKQGWWWHSVSRRGLTLEIRKGERRRESRSRGRREKVRASVFAISERGITLRGRP